jgi:hypothetical protein
LSGTMDNGNPCILKWLTLFLVLNIPPAIDSDDLFDVTQRNLIVLDYIMAQSGKDKPFADLLKGSHHWNRFVI